MMFKLLSVMLLILCGIVEMKPLNRMINNSDQILTNHRGEHPIIEREKRNHENLKPEQKGFNFINQFLNNFEKNVTENSTESWVSDTIMDIIYNFNVTNLLKNLFGTIMNKLQIQPQVFLQDPSNFSKKASTILERIATISSVTKSKPFWNTNGLIYVTGSDDDGFYTNRLEPSGFFGGNGWFANKGGLLGGPSAIFSTGSTLTDYPTSFKKRK